MTDRRLVLATSSTEARKQETTELRYRLTEELDDLEARIMELEMTMANHGIDSLMEEARETLH